MTALFLADEPIRRATPADAEALADLVHFASHGFALHVWRGLVGADADEAAVWAHGRKRRAEAAAQREIYVVDEGDGAIACLDGYPIDADPAPLDPNLPPNFAPLERLERQAPGSWYVNVLAAYPEHRGRGIGSRLLRLADAIALRDGLRGVSLITEDQNHGARRLYERAGFTERAREPIVAEGWATVSTDWILFERTLT